MVSAKNDVFVKYLLASEQTKDVSLRFFNAMAELLEIPLFHQIEIRNPFNAGRHFEEKDSALDVLLVNERLEQYHLEMQVHKNSFYEKRALYYWGGTYSRQSIKGVDYDALNPLISIHLLDFPLTEDPNDPPVDICSVKSHITQKTRCEDFKICFVELRKVAKLEALETSKAIRWFHFFARATGEKRPIEDLLQMDEDIQEAQEMLEMFNQKPELLTLAEAREKHLLDMASVRSSKIKEARAQGIAEGEARGEAKGIAKGKREFLSILRNNGSSVAEIAKLMSLPEKDIEDLLRDGD